MTRAIISIGILLALVGIGTFSGIWVGRQCGDMLGTAAEIRESCLSGDEERSGEKARELRREWEGFRGKAALILKNNVLTEIDRLTARIASGGQNSNSLLTDLSELEGLLEALKTSAEPRVTRIL